MISVKDALALAEKIDAAFPDAAEVLRDACDDLEDGDLVALTIGVEQTAGEITGITIRDDRAPEGDA